MKNEIYHAFRITDLFELEKCIENGPLASWDSLLTVDPTASFFQSPAWCMEWYRSYADCFRPLVLFVTCKEEMVGVVPLAVEVRTGRLVFAGDHMADYRDVVAAPGHREATIGELLRAYKAGDFQCPFRFGPTQPESETPRIILSNRSGEVRSIIRHHPCWRWWLGDGNSAEDPLKKESIRRRLNYYKRQGAISLERVETSEAWDGLKEEFFDYHTLRQMRAGRPVSFNDARKRSFYDALFRNATSYVHTVTLRVGARMVATHYGFIWRGVLYFGAPAFDIREEQHSPGLVMFALIIKNAQELGLRGIDLTLGTGDFKQRFANDFVELPTIEIYGRVRQYYTRKLRDVAVASAKSVVTNVKGAEAWGSIKRVGRGAAEKARSLYASGPITALTGLAKGRLSANGEKRGGLIFVANPADIQALPPCSAPGGDFSFHEDEITDLLKWDGESSEVRNSVAAAVREAAESKRKQRTLHTLLVKGRLAGWGWSHWPEGGSPLAPQTEAVFEFPPHSASISGVFIIPQYRGQGAAGALFSHILRKRFSEGAQQVYTVCIEKDAALRKAIEGAGFRLVPNSAA